MVVSPQTVVSWEDLTGFSERWNYPFSEGTPPRHAHDQHRAWMARLLSVHRLTVRNDIRTRKLAKPASSHLHKGVVKAPGGNSWDGIHFLSHRLSNFAKVRL